MVHSCTVLQAIETGQMLDFVPSIRKLPNTRYCCQNLEFFPNPNISNIRQLFSAENTAKNVFVVTLGPRVCEQKYVVP